MKASAILLFVLLPLYCLAQNPDDIKRFDNLFAVDSHKDNWGKQLKNNKNELTFIFSAAFVFYKEVLSSQDIDACVFTPSCSVYAIESIKKKGIVVGYFTAIDRLTRCNPGRKKDFHIDSQTGKYFDPVE
jgi:putative component of membrane protein insertase Oxa1/YidC/SpoIIIJ protein YidD